MAKITNISGFPEWLPEGKLLEKQLMSLITDTYELHGFVPIETPSVELLSTLEAKGVEQKELFVLQRRGAEEDKEAELGLHFDLTVPLARYVAQHLNDLVFPFRRYQLQRVWRGERPQKGRFREFYQCDIDIIAREQLPISCDAECLTVFESIYRGLDLCDFKIRVNNRRMLLGLYEYLEIAAEKRPEVIRIVDKIDKIGRDGVSAELSSKLGLEAQIIGKLLDFSESKATPVDCEEVFRGLGIESDLFSEGLNELQQIFSLMPSESLASFQIDFSLARGLDYYTGLILEVYFPDYPQYGSFGSGGRYENLASEFSSKKLPGVGCSVGVSRLMECILSEGSFEKLAQSSSQLLISVSDESQRADCNQLAYRLRSEGIACEVFFKSPKHGKQIEFADKKGIPFVLFIQEDGALELREIGSKESQRVEESALIEKLKSQSPAGLNLKGCLRKS